MLGLADYGSDDSPAPDPSAAADASAAPAAAPSSAGNGPSLLSVMEYGAEPDEADRAARRKGAERVGVSLDDDELDRGAQMSRVGGVGVQVSVTKRAAGSGSSSNCCISACTGCGCGCGCGCA